MEASTAGTNGHSVPVRIGGEVYPSARSAAQALGLSPNGVSGRCHSDRWPDYEWLGATPGPRRRFGSFDDRQIARPLVEPARWPFSGDLSRRAEVLDPDCEPPRVVRRVGYLRCLCCRRPHWSEDVARIRLCEECGGLGGTPVGARPDWDA